MYSFVHKLIQTYIQHCGCVCDIPNAFGVGKSHSCYLKKITDLEEIVVFFSSSSRLGIENSMQNTHFHLCRMYLMSDEMDSVASIRSGVYLLLSIFFEWRVHHHFRLHVIFLFCASVCFSFYRFTFQTENQWIFLTVPGYIHNIYFVSFSSDFINIKSTFSTWITHNHFY